MAWLYVPEVATSNSDSPLPCELTASICDPSATLSATLTPSSSCESASKMGRLTKLPYGMMSSPSTMHLGVERWISSLPDIHVRERAWQAAAPARMTPDGYGLTSGESFARWERGIWRSRTSQLTLAGLSDMSRVTWPRAGGVWSGIAYRLQPLAPLSAAIEYSLSLHRQWLAGLMARSAILHLTGEGLLPSPTRADARKSSDRQSNQGGWSITAAIVGACVIRGTTHRRLNPAFIAWLLGAPMSSQLSDKRRIAVLGNAVVPRAAAMAFAELWRRL